MVAFYNQGDQEIYNSGNKFVPQERYRLGYTPTVNEQKVEQTFGIPNTNAFTNSGNDFSVYNPDPNSIVNKNYDPYPYRQAGEIYSKTFNPQPFTDQNKLGVRHAQKMYNKASGDIDAKGLNARTQTLTGTNPSKEVLDFYDKKILANQEKYRTQGQYVDPYDPRYSSRTGAQKFMDNFPEYYTKPEPTGLARLGELAGSLMPGAGIARLIGDYLPVNRRSILENELSGQGVMVNNIGQIVQGDGAYDTAGNVMAGYNANKLTAESFDKRIAMAKEKMSAENKGARIKALEEAKANFLKAQGKTDLVFEDEEVKKKKKKKKGNIITKFLNKKKETKAADAATAAAERANRAGQIAAQKGADEGVSGDGRGSRRGDADISESSRGGFATDDTAGFFAKGGRAGYFFGGRVNFKDGGLASIL